MIYEIFKSIPHQKVVSKHQQADEIFNLYQLGNFPTENSVEENVELVELEPDSLYRPHFHKKSAAIIYIILGTGVFRFADDFLKYQPGKRIAVPAGILHGFKTETRTLFLSIQSPGIIDADGQIDLHYEKDNSDAAPA